MSLNKAKLNNTLIINHVSKPSVHRSPRQQYTVQAGPYQLNLGRQTRIMGIINMTPDSFSADGQWAGRKPCSLSTTVRRAKRMVREGADILDVGGESSRPGAKAVNAAEEGRRILPVIRKLAQSVKVPISVDTYKSTVAREALDAGATIVNNIKGTQTSTGLLKMIQKYNAAIVLMHMRGTPQVMQKSAHYTDVIEEIFASLHRSIEKCLDIGIKSDRIIIDPGIGFGKTLEHNLKLINRLCDFSKLRHPLLIGTSRKSFIGSILDKNVKERIHGTTASVTASIMRGAHIVRVHDVPAVYDTVRITDAVLNEGLIEP